MARPKKEERRLYRKNFREVERFLHPPPTFNTPAGQIQIFHRHRNGSVQFEAWIDDKPLSEAYPSPGSTVSYSLPRAAVVEAQGIPLDVFTELLPGFSEAIELDTLHEELAKAVKEDPSGRYRIHFCTESRGLRLQRFDPETRKWICAEGS
jgi:hypothetical protein